MAKLFQQVALFYLSSWKTLTTVILLANLLLTRFSSMDPTHTLCCPSKLDCMILLDSETAPVKVSLFPRRQA